MNKIYYNRPGQPRRLSIHPHDRGSQQPTTIKELYSMATSTKYMSQFISLKKLVSTILLRHESTSFQSCRPPTPVYQTYPNPTTITKRHAARHRNCTDDAMRKLNVGFYDTPMRNVDTHQIPAIINHHHSDVFPLPRVSDHNKTRHAKFTPCHSRNNEPLMARTITTTTTLTTTPCFQICPT